MILSKQSRENIKDLKEDYEKHNKIANFIFYEKVFSILKQEEKFRGIYNCEILKQGNSKTLAYLNDGKILYFIPSILKEAEKKGINDGIVSSSYDLIQFKNMWSLITILHESSHLWQLSDCEDYKEINSLYKDLYYSIDDMSRFRLFLYNKKYTKKGTSFCQERHANIDAFRETAAIYSNSKYRNYLEMNHVFNLDQKAKGISIVHDTLKICGLDYNYNIEDIPIWLLLDAGFPIEKQVSEKINHYIQEYSENELEYSDLMEKIKKL